MKPVAFRPRPAGPEAASPTQRLRTVVHAYADQAVVKEGGVVRTFSGAHSGSHGIGEAGDTPVATAISRRRTA